MDDTLAAADGDTELEALPASDGELLADADCEAEDEGDVDTDGVGATITIVYETDTLSEPRASDACSHLKGSDTREKTQQWRGCRVANGTACASWQD